MRQIELAEYERRDIEGLTEAQATALHASGAVAVEFSARRGVQTLVASQHVGVVVTQGIQLNVRPKVAVPQLLRMIVSSRTDPWLDTMGSALTSNDLVEALVGAFIAESDRAFQQGVLQGYVTAEESSTVLRGRIRMGDQLSRHTILPLPLEITYDDFSEDIPENRYVATAARRLRRLGTLPVRHRRSVIQLCDRLNHVSDLNGLPDVRISRLNQRYSRVIAIARLILQSIGTEHQRGATETTTFLIDMNRLFEQFVTDVLTRSAPAGTTVRAQYPSTLDDAGRIDIRPDIVWTRRSRPIAVADAKYKSIHSKQLPNADVYQALAYATALGLDRAHLIYARGNEAPARYRLRNTESVVAVHALSLDQPFDALVDEVTQLGGHIAPGNQQSAA